MGQPDASIDPRLFERTVSRFTEKRSMLAPSAVEALAGDIVRRLAALNGGAPRVDAATVEDHSLSAFCDALLAPEPAGALAFLMERQAEGVTRQTIYLGYVAGAARRLGEGWDSGRLSFMDVTIASGHLYALMRALRAERNGRGALDARRFALFATVPGEDHGIGITVAADLFRDAGWEIDLHVGSDHDALVAQVERIEPEIIGLSLSTEDRLDALVRLVVAIRLVVPHALIGVAPAATLDATRVERIADIDLLFGDARSSLVELDRLIRLRG